MMANRPDLSVSGFARGLEAYRREVTERKAALRAELAEWVPSGDSLVLEIGAGHGHFLSAYAAAHSAQVCLGIDIISDRVRRAMKKKERAGLSNLTFLRCEATEFFDCLPSGVLFDRIFVLFPDPWPKKRHHKNRLLSAAFFNLAARHSACDAEIYFRTDFLPYFEEVEATVGAHPLWQAREARWPFEKTTVFQQRAEGYFSMVIGRCAGARLEEIEPEDQEDLNQTGERQERVGKEEERVQSSGSGANG